MKKDKRHIIDIDQLLNQELSNSYQPSASFVDDVMTRITALDIEKPAAKYIKFAFKAAAACACVVFLFNTGILISSKINLNDNDTDWASIYQSETTTNWYEYINDESFLANNQITK